MHHYRGRLLDGEKTHLDPANVYVQLHHPDPSNPDPGWYGYLVVPDEGAVELGASYTLELADGRTGDLQVERIAPDESGKFRAYFFGDGPLR